MRPYLVHLLLVMEKQLDKIDRNASAVLGHQSVPNEAKRLLNQSVQVCSIFVPTQYYVCAYVLYTQYLCTLHMALIMNMVCSGCIS